MSKVKMISTGTHRYEGVWLYNGDPFEANNDQDADELKILGFATRAPSTQTYQTRVMTAAAPAAPVGETRTQDASAEATGAPPAADQPAERQKRPYNRRMVVASQ